MLLFLSESGGGRKTRARYVQSPARKGTQLNLVGRSGPVGMRHREFHPSLCGSNWGKGKILGVASWVHGGRQNGRWRRGRVIERRHRRTV